MSEGNVVPMKAVEVLDYDAKNCSGLEVTNVDLMAKVFAGKFLGEAYVAGRPIDEVVVDQPKFSAMMEAVFNRGSGSIDAGDGLPGRNEIVCMECGKAYKLLSNRHLALHDLSPRTYKKKYGIPMTTPLSSKALTARRRKLAKEMGMGSQLAEWREEQRKLKTVS